MFAKMGLSAKLYAGFAAVLAVFLALGGFLFTKLDSVSTHERIITGDCLPGTAAIGRLASVARENFELIPDHFNAKDDAGKGFAVVAEEVRNLAQRSAEAAKSTSALIEESQKNAERGVAVSSEVADILGVIVEKVRKLAQLIGEVSAASQEQTKGIGQISKAVEQMDKVTQANAASAEESASASEEMFAQSKELADMVSVLVDLVKGAERAVRRAPASIKPKHDWKPVPAARAAGNAGTRPVKTAVAESIIPLEAENLKDS